jgi:hypothetical protein
MIKVFIEYKVEEGKKERFLALLSAMRDKMNDWQAQQYRVYEGTDQPLLMVEEFFVPGQDEYERFKASRLGGSDPFWNEVHDCVAGGAGKVHIWAFREMESSS